VRFTNTGKAAASVRIASIQLHDVQSKSVLLPVAPSSTPATDSHRPSGRWWSRSSAAPRLVGASSSSR
jgi:hypothetical protein